MADYTLPTISKPEKVKKNQVLLVASGDLRPSANQKCWPAQQEMEQALAKPSPKRATNSCGLILIRRPRSTVFIGSQREGIEVFRKIDPQAKLIVAEAVWQYSHHVLPGLLTHEGPDADRRQLVGHLAGPGRHAEPERLAHQGRPQVLDALERRLHRRVLHARPGDLAGEGRAQASYTDTCGRSPK